MFALFRSSAFRITLLYMVLFGASVTALLIFLYTTIISGMEENTKHAITIQMADLRRKFNVTGPAETAASINIMMEKDQDKTLVLLLIDNNWKILAGNMERWPGGTTNRDMWIKFTLDKSHSTGPSSKAIAMNAALPGGYIMLVGRKTDDIESVRQAMVDVLYISFGIMFAMAAVGGLLLSYMIYRRVETINQVFRQVAGGTLTARARVTGTGDEFDHLAMHLNQTLTRITELIDGISDISYSVAHDLRTPLHRLRHRLESLLASNPTPAQVQEQLRTSLADIDSLVGTFNAILRISQAETGTGIDQFALFNMSEVVEDVMDLYQPVAEDKAHHLSANIAEAVMIHGDRHLVTQTVANIVDNAIKYTPKGGSIAISLEAAAGVAVLKVADNGIGIPEALRHRVTEKFFRLEQSRSSPGNGLGLSLVSAAIKLHKGELRFEDNAPGLVVVLRLPAAS